MGDTDPLPAPTRRVGRAQDVLSNTKGDLHYTKSQPQEQPAAAAKVPSGDGVAFTACQMFPIVSSRGFDLMSVLRKS